MTEQPVCSYGSTAPPFDALDDPGTAPSRCAISACLRACVRVRVRSPDQSRSLLRHQPPISWRPGEGMCLIRRWSLDRVHPDSSPWTHNRHLGCFQPKTPPDITHLGSDSAWTLCIKASGKCGKKPTCIFLDRCLTGMKLRVCVCVCMCVAVIASGSCLCLHQEGSDGRASVPERARLPLQTSGVFQRLQGVQGNIPTRSCPVSVPAAPCGST